MVVHGIVSDVTKREEADARVAEVSDRFTRLLDVIGEHVYLALAHPDGRIEELFQGPGADRLLGGADARPGDGELGRGAAPGGPRPPTTPSTTRSPAGRRATSSTA